MATSTAQPADDKSQKGSASLRPDNRSTGESSDLLQFKESVARLPIADQVAAVTPPQPVERFPQAVTPNPFQVQLVAEAGSGAGGGERAVQFAGSSNPYKATRSGGKIKGDFANFVWDGYPPISVTPHPVNAEYGHANGTKVPQPTGKYTVPTGKPYGGAPSTAGWREKLYKERDDIKADMKAKNPSLKPVDIDRQAKKQVEKKYDMTWCDLDLQGWEAHHIHPRDWNGSDDASNFQYLKEKANPQKGGAPTGKHSPFTTWWDKVRKPDIEKQVK